MQERLKGADASLLAVAQALGLAVSIEPAEETKSG